MTHRNVLPNRVGITESDYRALVAKSVLRLSAANGCDRLALDVGGVDGRTLRNTRDEKTSLNGATLFNLLTIDLTALDELLAHFGVRAVAIDGQDAEDHRLLADTMALAAAHADALADGTVDHNEAAHLDKLSGPVLRGWSARKLRAVA
jgi:hypothetical protein